ncbi:MAG: sigma-70 family RNA polymerase sigma factor [Planctomycetota bacterium]
MNDWSKIVQRHGPLVWTTTYRLLNDHADASDCFQETFLSAWKLSERESIQNWPALLKRLATARSLELLRRRYRETERQDAWPEQPLPDDRLLDPSDEVSQHERVERLRACLSHLDPRQAEAFCLSTFEDWSYREIADQLGIAVGHVGVMLHRAKKSLRQLWEMVPGSSDCQRKPAANVNTYPDEQIAEDTR